MNLAKKMLTLFLLPVFFASGAWAKSGLVQIKGSDTIVNVVQAWAEEYMKKRPEAYIAVTGGGSGTGFAALINGTCDIAAASREIKPREIKLAGAKNIEPQEFKVALDGLAVVVHPSNPVSSLTLDQLALIFSGTVKNWSEIGGTSAPIVILSREVNSGTHVYFKEHVLRKEDPDSKVEFSPSALLLPSSQAIADEVAQNSAAIGYYGMGYLSARQKAVTLSRAPGQAPVPPTVENIISGAYPISRPLYFYTPGVPTGEVKGFVDYVLSDEGQSIVEKLDFVPIKK